MTIAHGRDSKQPRSPRHVTACVKAATSFPLASSAPVELIYWEVLKLQMYLLSSFFKGQSLRP
jgi:hypothetical protein